MSSPGNLRFSPWNLLLLVPFLMLLTPLYNSLEPRLFGLPFFYWAQFVFVPVGVVCVAVVYVKTRTQPTVPASATTNAATTNPTGDVDDLDEGAAR